MHCSACLNFGSCDISVRRLSIRMTCSCFGVPSVFGTGPLMIDDVAGEQLRGGAARQRGENRHDVGEVGHQLLDADDGDVNLGQRRDQAGIAFVGDDDQAAGFGDGDVRAGDAHLGVEEFGAQLAARELHQLGDVGRLALLDLCR